MIGKIVNVDTSATLLLTSNNGEQQRFLKNIGSAIIYIGSDNLVTVNNGFPLRINEEIDLSNYHGDLYGITDTTASNVTIFED